MSMRFQCTASGSASSAYDPAAALEAEIHELRRRLNPTMQRSTISEENLRNLRVEIANVADQIRCRSWLFSGAQLESLSSEVAIQKGVLGDLSASLRAGRGALQQARRRIARYRRARLAGELRSQRDGIAALHGRIHAAVQEHRDLKAKWQAVTSGEATAASEIGALQERLASAHAALAGARRDFDSAEQRQTQELLALTESAIAGSTRGAELGSGAVIGRKTVVIGRFEKKMRKRELLPYLTQIGVVEEIQCVRDGGAYVFVVTFKKPKSAETAIGKLNGRRWRGVRLSAQLHRASASESLSEVRPFSDSIRESVSEDEKAPLDRAMKLKEEEENSERSGNAENARAPGARPLEGEVLMTDRPSEFRTAETVTSDDIKPITVAVELGAQAVDPGITRTPAGNAVPLATAERVEATTEIAGESIQLGTPASSVIAAVLAVPCGTAEHTDVATETLTDGAEVAQGQLAEAVTPLDAAARADIGTETMTGRIQLETPESATEEPAQAVELETPASSEAAAHSDVTTQTSTDVIQLDAPISVDLSTEETVPSETDPSADATHELPTKTVELAIHANSEAAPLGINATTRASTDIAAGETDDSAVATNALPVDALEQEIPRIIELAESLEIPTSLAITADLPVESVELKTPLANTARPGLSSDETSEQAGTTAVRAIECPPEKIAVLDESNADAPAIAAELSSKEISDQTGEAAVREVESSPEGTAELDENPGTVDALATAIKLPGEQADAPALRAIESPTEEIAAPDESSVSAPATAELSGDKTGDPADATAVRAIESSPEGTAAPAESAGAIDALATAVELPGKQGDTPVVRAIESPREETAAPDESSVGAPVPAVELSGKEAREQADVTAVSAIEFSREEIAAPAESSVGAPAAATELAGDKTGEQAEATAVRAIESPPKEIAAPDESSVGAPAAAAEPSSQETREQTGETAVRAIEFSPEEIAAPTESAGAVDALATAGELPGEQADAPAVRAIESPREETAVPDESSVGAPATAAELSGNKTGETAERTLEEADQLAPTEAPLDQSPGASAPPPEEPTPVEVTVELPLNENAPAMPSQGETAAQLLEEEEEEPDAGAIRFPTPGEVSPTAKETQLISDVATDRDAPALPQLPSDGTLGPPSAQEKGDATSLLDVSENRMSNASAPVEAVEIILYAQSPGLDGGAVAPYGPSGEPPAEERPPGGVAVELEQPL
jgi:hypothetical protein